MDDQTVEVGYDSAGYPLTAADVVMIDPAGHPLAVGDLVYVAMKTGPGGYGLELAQIIGGGTNAPIEVVTLANYTLATRVLNKRARQLAFYSDKYRDMHLSFVAELFAKNDLNPHTEVQ